MSFSLTFDQFSVDHLDGGHHEAVVPRVLHPEDGAPGKVAVLDPDVEGLDLVGALVGVDKAKEDLEAVVELKERRDLVERHVPEVDARKLEKINPI